MSSEVEIIQDDYIVTAVEEYNRAKDRKLEILIFRDETIEPEDKEGRLNDWIRELENFHSLADYSEIDDLTEKLLERLRGLASQELTVWAKLGNIVFQCTEMSQEIVAGSKNTRISARTRDQRILQALTQMDHQLRYLTFGNESSPVKVLNATTSRVSPNETQVQLELEETIDRDIPMDPFPITVRVGNRTYTSSDRAQLWIQRYIFGKDPGLEENFGFVLSEYPVVDLKELLQASVQLPSRLLRQLARLYIVEHILYFWAGTVRSCIVTGETPGNLNLELEWAEHPQYADEEPETHEISGNF